MKARQTKKGKNVKSKKEKAFEAFKLTILHSTKEEKNRPKLIFDPCCVTNIKKWQQKPHSDEMCIVWSAEKKQKKQKAANSAICICCQTIVFPSVE